MIRKCRECGASVPLDAPRGVCPKCELRGALRTSLGLTEAAAGKEGSPGAITPLTAGLESGVPFGDYELLEEIFHGGMGIVYRARQKSLGRIVAVKMLPFGSLASAEFVKRFHTEASAAASLQHTNIVTVHEVGVWEGQHYLVMSFINGSSLADFVAQGPLPAWDAARYLKKIAEAIHYAHEHGILHRDLKPSNILVDENDEPQVTDFGLAKRLDGESTLTLAGQILGSPNYMPPEQASAQPGTVTRRSDIYGLGAVLYHLLTARAPFQAASVNEAIQQVLNAEPAAPRLLNPSVPIDLETICLKCLEKEPARRYATAQNVADELGRFLRGEPIQARPIRIAGRFGRWCRRQPLVAALAGATAAALLAGSLLSVLGFMAAKKKSEAAQRSARKAGRIADILLEFIATAQPASGKASGPAVRLMLKEFSDGLAEKVAGEPEVEVMVRVAIAYAYLESYETAQAWNHLSRALELVGTEIPVESLDAANVFNAVGQFYNLNEQTSEAQFYFDRAYALFKPRLPPDHPDLHKVRIALATCERDRGNLDRAYQLLSEVVQSTRKESGVRVLDLWRANALRFRSGICRMQGRFTDSRKCIQEWRSALAPHFRTNHQLVLLADFNEALLLREQSRASGNRKLMEDAIALLGGIYRVQLRALPTNHIDTWETAFELAATQFQAGHTNEAMRRIRSLEQRALAKNGPDHSFTRQVRSQIKEMEAGTSLTP